MKPYIIGICILLSSILNGCSQPKTLEKMGMITTLGYDLEDNQIRSTMLLLQIDPEAQQNTALLSAKAKTSKGARIKADLISPKELQSGQLRVALYSEELARHGIINFADTLARDPSISDLTYLAVVEGSAYELMKHKNDQFSDIGQYIYKELDQNIKRELIPSVTLQETMHAYYSEGIDPILPTLKLVDSNVRITGIALMNKDKMVGKLSPYQAFYLNLLNEKYKAGKLEISVSKKGLPISKDAGLPTDLTIVLDTIKSSSKIKLVNKTIPEFDIAITIQARLLEINQAYELKKPENVKKLEKSLEKKMKKEVNKLISYTQTIHSDPFGFGETYRKSVRHANLNHSKWHRMYKDSQMNVHVNIKIMRTGAVE